MIKGILFFNGVHTLAMACGGTSNKRVFWLVLGLVATSARSQPITADALQGGGVSGGVLRPEKDLQDLGTDNGHMKILANTLEHVFRHGRELQTRITEEAGRQTAATLATSLGDLFRPAITAFVGALTMNSATSITNAITALFGGRSLDLIPAETFMTAPIGREDSVLQPTRDSTVEEVQKRRPLRRKQTHPIATF